MTWLQNYRDFVMRSKCFYCGRLVSQCDKDSRPTRDHKIPSSRGGIAIPANLVTACHKCNVDKGALTHEEYRDFWITIKNFRNLSTNNHIRITDIRFAGEVRA